MLSSLLSISVESIESIGLESIGQEFIITDLEFIRLDSTRSEMK